MTIRVNGGIISDQMLAGSLRFFKMTGPFTFTVSDGTVQLPGTELYANNNDGQPMTVGDGDPVAGSAADYAFRAITEKCSVVQIGLASATEIHFATDASAFGWADASEIQSAVSELGSITVPNASATGTSADLSTVTISEVDFVLA